MIFFIVKKYFKRLLGIPMYLIIGLSSKAYLQAI